MKGLEALEDLYNLKAQLLDGKIHIKANKNYKNPYDQICYDVNIYNKFSYALIIIEKELKALEIIKEKEPDISFLFRVKDLNHYNSCVWKEQELTQEEFDLLKEVLNEIL